MDSRRLSPTLAPRRRRTARGRSGAGRDLSLILSAYSSWPNYEGDFESIPLDAHLSNLTSDFRDIAALHTFAARRLAHHRRERALRLGRVDRNTNGRLLRARARGERRLRAPKRLARDAPRARALLPVCDGAAARGRAAAAAHLRLFALGAQVRAAARRAGRGGAPPRHHRAGGRPPPRPNRHAAAAAGRRRRGGERPRRRRALLLVLDRRVDRRATATASRAATSPRPSSTGPSS